MTTSSRNILTCAYNRRRRSFMRVMPNHIDESTIQTSKPKLPVAIMKTTSQSKLTILSENDSLPVPSLTSASMESTESDITSSRPQAVFRRQRADSIDEREVDEDMFMLKRANPVYESDDEDDLYLSPSKRQRTGEPTSILSFCDRIDEDDAKGLFSISESAFLSR